ncbi:MAG: ATP-dependent sacrificial sulfur transferase LarE [Nitrospiraceae bacterium]
MLATLSDKLLKMQSLLKDMRSVLVAFSGGIDSTLVLKVAYDALGQQAIGVTAVSPTLPEIELEVARRLGAQIGARLVIIETNQLEIEDFIRNDASRCYHCKADLYQALGRLQRELRFGAIVDGTNLDDLGDDRPGIAAAREWGVRSPLVESELSKAEIRVLARELGLSNWDKPAAACLSSRIPRGITITRERLTRVEQAEAILFHEGFKQFRVRDHGEIARIELDDEGLAQMLDRGPRTRVTTRLKELGFRFVTVDLEGYRRGSSN